MERIERGWAGHYICGPDCRWRRNTLIVNDDGREIIVSSVGRLTRYDHKKGLNVVDYIGHKRWYETKAFIAKKDGEYTEVDVEKYITLPENIEWCVDHEPEENTDIEAEKIHEDVVSWVMGNFDEAYNAGEAYYKENH